MEEKQCERGIMLYRKKLTPSAKKVRQSVYYFQFSLLSQASQLIRPASFDVFVNLIRILYVGKKNNTQTIQELQGDYKIEEYAEADLVVNITKHFLVPKHTIMSDKDKKELLSR